MLDIIIIIFVGVIGFIAMNKGFIKTAYQIIAYVVALIVSFMIYPIMSGILKVTPIYEGIKEWNIRSISAIPVVEGVQAQTNTIREVTSWLPEFMTNQMIQNNNPEIYNLMNVDNLIEYISIYVADLCINALALLIVWVVVRIGLGLIVGTLDLVARLPFLNLANKGAGFILGIIKGIFMIWTIYLIVPFLVIFPSLVEIQILIQKSLLGKWLYDNNFILSYLNQIFF